MVRIGNDWDAILAPEWEKPYYLALREFLKREYAENRVYPPMGEIFNALRYTACQDVKVVILGQDPYHGEGQAHGLCFSVRRGVEPPPSLKNIYKELESDLGFTPPAHGELTAWAKQGVLLLNTTLTVRAASPLSHQGQGWEILTDEIIRILDRSNTPIVFILWGGHARTKKALIESPIHCVIESAHPSPLSAYHGFFGSHPFSRANAFLESHGRSPVLWSAICE